MKKTPTLILLFIFTALLVNAQDKIILKETFENNRFHWDEFYEKDCSAGIQDGFFILQNKKNGTLIRSVSELPVSMDKNFKITFKFLIPKITDDYSFGIVYNYDDENNYSSFLVSEKKYKIYNNLNGTLSISRQGGIILKAGKNKEVIIEIERKGNKLIFNVDNMETVIITKDLKYNTFGFQVENANTIKVDEIIIEQLTEEE